MNSLQARLSQQKNSACLCRSCHVRTKILTSSCQRVTTDHSANLNLNEPHSNIPLLLEILSHRQIREGPLVIAISAMHPHWGFVTCEGLSLANQISRKLGGFDRKFEGSHSIFYYHFDTY